MRWKVTAKGWVGACPVWLSDLHTASPVPIPRTLWLGWWLEFNLWFQDAANFILMTLDPEIEPGFVLHHVREVEPFTLDIR